MSPRVLFLVAGAGEASCRFRVLQYLPHLQRRGIATHVADLHVPLGRRRRLLLSAAEYDVVCVHRVLLTAIEQRWLQRVAPRYIFDFDDAIMFRDSQRQRFVSWQRRHRFARMVAGAHRVIAGNRYLADAAFRYTDRVTVIPTAIDLTPYPNPPHRSRDPVIGWIGTRANLMYLRAVLPALARLSRTRPEITLKIVADDFFDGPHLRIIKKPWSLEDEVADVTSFQVGIMPLPDDPWTRGKCAVKILQYFAAAVPVVCSPVGTNLDVVEHGRSGYFATADDEWVNYLDDLLGNAERRTQFGAAGRETVRQRYSIEATLDALITALLE